MKPPQLIKKLKAEKRLFGTCPECGQDFRISSASLFSLTDQFPDQALAKIGLIKAALKEGRRDLQDLKKRMTGRAQLTAASVNLGKILEKIAPSFRDFQFATHDCRALLEPIDYLIFSGLSKNGLVESVTFLDVKSGGARLTANQKRIAEVIESGRVDVELINQPRRAGQP